MLARIFVFLCRFAPLKRMLWRRWYNFLAFNLMNVKNPFIPLTTRRLSAAGAPLSSFMQPTAFAGDFQQPEQRVGQIGFRITF